METISPTGGRKARNDAKLKNLDGALLVEIVKQARAIGLIPTVTWLATEHGVQTSKTALGESLPYLESRARSWLREQAVLGALEDEKLRHPDLKDEELFEMGQRFFARQAIADADARGWTSVQSLSLERDRFRESIRSKLQAGLDALAEAFKSSPQAMKLYQQARAMIEEATT